MRFFLRLLTVWFTKIVAKVSLFFNIGAGGTWPGEIALIMAPWIFSDLAKDLGYGVIFIAGTNGKTTTTKLIRTILKTQADRSKPTSIVYNASGANLLNGITSTLLQATDIFGRIKSNIGVFEVDEATLPNALREITPRIVVLLNLFRDQLDRYGEVDIVAEKWLEALKRLPKSTTVLINADDPHLTFIGENIKANIKYFGLGNSDYFLKTVPIATDTIYCPQCRYKLNFTGMYLSHLGEWHCSNCDLTHPMNVIESGDIEPIFQKAALSGVYNRYNVMAAILTTNELGFKNVKRNHEILKSFTPVFGRQEKIKIDGKTVQIILSKNPAGFNASLSMVLEKKPSVLLLVLNDHIPDGRDVSWIWDVEFEMIPKSVIVIVSGDRVYDLALRMKYASESPRSTFLSAQNDDAKINMFEDILKAITFGLQKTKNGNTLYILPTYSAMLEVRKILKGRKIL